MLERLLRVGLLLTLIGAALLIGVTLLVSPEGPATSYLSGADLWRLDVVVSGVSEGLILVGVVLAGVVWAQLRPLLQPGWTDLA